MPQELLKKAFAQFEKNFGSAPAVQTFAPGRVEILGNHTDYNQGLVLGVAIDRFTVVVGRPVSGTTATIFADAFDQTDAIDLSESSIDTGPEGDWRRYTRGVIWALRSQLPSNQGFEAVVMGNVPLGAGLSSSASLQVALGLFLQKLHGQSIENDEARMGLAKRLRKAENGFVGVASGLLDFVTVLFGRKGDAVFLDCQNLNVQRVNLGQNPPAIVVMDTSTSRRLADGMYNIRRSECERIVDHFRKLKSVSEVSSLRDITPEELSANWKYLDPVGRLRARHVLLENQRVLDGVGALNSGDLATLGLLVSRSHKSSMTDFQNSSEALDILVGSALTAPGCLGAKLSGAGWAGCVVALVEPELVDQFTRSCAAGYREKTGLEAEIYVAYSAGCSDA